MNKESRVIVKLNSDFSARDSFELAELLAPYVHSIAIGWDVLLNEFDFQRWQEDNKLFFLLNFYDIKETVLRAVRIIDQSTSIWGCSVSLDVQKETLHTLKREVSNNWRIKGGQSPLQIFGTKPGRDFAYWDWVNLHNFCDGVIFRHKDKDFARIKSLPLPQSIILTDVESPTEVVKQGVDYVILGEEITGVGDPVLAVERINDEIETAKTAIKLAAAGFVGDA